MYVNIRKYKVKPGSLDQLMPIVKDGFLPLISKAEGFVSYSAIRQDGETLVTVSTFREKSGADQSNLLAANFIREKNLASMIPNPPEVIGGEAEVHLWSGSGATLRQ